MSSSQTAMGPGRGTWIPDANQADPRVLAHRAHYVFNPVETGIALDAKTVGLKTLRPQRIELVKTHHYPDRSNEDDVMEGRAEPYLETYENPAAGIVDMIVNQYDRCGVVIVKALLGAPDALKGWVEEVLLGGAPPLFIQFQAFVEAESPARIQRAAFPQELAPPCHGFFGTRAGQPRDPRHLLEMVHAELLASCAKGETYLRDYYGDYNKEMQDAAKGKNGIGRVHPKLRWACEQLGVPTPDDLAAEVARLRAQGAAGQAAQQVVVAPAPDGIERAQCPRCYEPVALKGGRLPTYCKHCGADPRALAEAELAELQEQVGGVVESGLSDTAPGAATSSDNFTDPTPTGGAPAPGGSSLSEKAEGVFGEAGKKTLCGDFGGVKRDGSPCKNGAGSGTDHPGAGRCNQHEE